jgi:hypothetical protein
VREQNACMGVCPNVRGASTAVIIRKNWLVDTESEVALLADIENESVC